ncbi:NUDIX domain-containing protein [Pseudaestuariivita rosea]|uniref:NUDIX domain-containing protein n=1 Tax=Pseudaestuariivita rosea TaxID=2763263 RepID=UPI001ABA825E|nr:NUDIX hydrolase [Pseudaestuariivita rosea]
MARRFGERIDKKAKYKVRPGCYAILIRGRSVLLTYQMHPHYEFQLPGGGIDPGENPLSALHREVYEETGWHISAPRKLGVYRRFTYMPEYEMNAEKICHIYVARPVLALTQPSEPDHLAVWMPIEGAIFSVDSDGDRHFLERFYG